MKTLFEAAKSELIKRHNAKKAELEEYAENAKMKWHAAVRELEAHKKTHPNYAKIKAKLAARQQANDGWEEGRSTPRKNGNW